MLLLVIGVPVLLMLATLAMERFESGMHLDGGGLEGTTAQATGEPAVLPRALPTPPRPLRPAPRPIARPAGAGHVHLRAAG
jgi:hypothetical protein